MSSLPWYVWAAALIIFAAAAVAKARASGTKEQHTYAAAEFLNSTELNTLRSLQAIAPTNTVVFAQVALRAILLTKHTDKSAANAIGQKYVDFAIYDTTSKKIRCVIEIDGPKHASERQTARDKVKDAALRSAGIAVHRLSPDETKNPENLRRICNATVGTSESSDGKSVNTINPRTSERTQRKPIKRQSMDERRTPTGI